MPSIACNSASASRCSSTVPAPWVSSWPSCCGRLAQVLWRSATPTHRVSNGRSRSASRSWARTTRLCAQRRPRGYDNVIEATGVTRVANDAMAAVAKGGKLMIFGVSPAGEQAGYEPFRVYNEEITIVGSMAVLRQLRAGGRPRGRWGGRCPADALPYRWPGWLQRSAGAGSQRRRTQGTDRSQLVIARDHRSERRPGRLYRSTGLPRGIGVLPHAGPWVNGARRCFAPISRGARYRRQACIRTGGDGPLSYVAFSLECTISDRDALDGVISDLTAATRIK